MRPKHPRTRACRPSPVQLQLPLFADTACLVRIRPALNEWRFYRMEVCPPQAIPTGCAGRNLEPASPHLFGCALIMRQWGRIGTEGTRRLDPHPDPGAVINALAQLATAKRHRGYQDRTP